jgi:hypothetical protein
VLPAEAAEVVAAALRQAHAQGYSGGLQYELPLPAGHRWFELSVSRKPLPEGETPRFIALARDITERKQADAEHQALERQLREAQKMESIGTLAGGIAHDFNKHPGRHPGQCSAGAPGPEPGPSGAVEPGPGHQGRPARPQPGAADPDLQPPPAQRTGGPAPAAGGGGDAFAAAGHAAGVGAAAHGAGRQRAVGGGPTPPSCSRW